MKKIFIFSSVHNWDDTRIFYKQAVSLTKRYHVELHAPAEFNNKIFKAVKVYGLPTWAKVNDRKEIRSHLWERIKKSDADIFHFHDPELIPIGLLIKLLTKRKVIYDVHENYSAYIRNKYWVPKVLRGLVAMLFKYFELFSSKVFDGIICATPGISEMFYRPRRKHIIFNYPILDYFKKSNNAKIKNRTRLIYVGNIEPIRGILEFGTAFNEFRKANPNIGVDFHIVGKLAGTDGFKDELGKLFQLENIIYHGHQSFENAVAKMRECHIGVIPLLPAENYLDSLPVKLFEYMAAGLVIISSDFPLWQSIIDKYDIGTTFDPLSTNSICDALSRVITSPTEMKRKSGNSRKSALKYFSWHLEEKKLFAAYKELLKD